MTDHDIVLLARRGEERAYRELFERYFARVFRIALVYSRYHEEDAKDITQKAFISAFRRIGTLEDPGKFGPWIKTITRRVAMRHLADKRKRAETTIETDYMIDESLLECGEDDQQAALMEIAAVRQVIESIPNESIKETVRMYYTESGLNTQEIAERQNLSQSTVKSRINRFRARYAKIVIRRILSLRGEK